MLKETQDPSEYDEGRLKIDCMSLRFDLLQTYILCLYLDLLCLLLLHPGKISKVFIHNFEWHRKGSILNKCFLTKKMVKL